jgi:hypothetical protein
MGYRRWAYGCGKEKLKKTLRENREGKRRRVKDSAAKRETEKRNYWGKKRDKRGKDKKKE